MDRYTAKLLEKVPTKPGCWEYSKVGVFKDDEQIGEYTRNYHALGENTFCPFIGADGKWYALYSENYMATYVMELPSCKKVAGEDLPYQQHFCPVDYFVPRYRIWMRKAITGEKLKTYPEQNWKWLSKDKVMRDYEEPGENPPEFEERALAPEHESECGEFVYRQGIHYDLHKGFVAGCIWGDDCSWKIELLDLTKVHNGKIVRSQPFGYIEKPWNIKLRECVWVEGDDGENVNISVQSHYRMKDSKVTEKYEM